MGIAPYEVLSVNGVVGVGLPDDPPSLAPHLLQKPCHCEPVTDSLLWQSVPPSLAPLPKGGWHGEAVTGGFFSHIPNNVSVGAGFYPARSSAPLVTDAGRCGHRPLQNPIGKPSVGADAYIGPLPGLHKFPCHP